MIEVLEARSTSQNVSVSSLYQLCPSSQCDVPDRATLCLKTINVPADKGLCLVTVCFLPFPTLWTTATTLSLITGWLSVIYRAYWENLVGFIVIFQISDTTITQIVKKWISN